MPRSTYIGKDGIAVRNDLGGLNWSTVPKVFIETGNMRNATDAALLKSAGGGRAASQGWPAVAVPGPRPSSPGRARLMDRRI